LGIDRPVGVNGVDPVRQDLGVKAIDPQDKIDHLAAV
jgi:hypothetical protein